MASDEGSRKASGFYGKDGGIYREDRGNYQAESDWSLNVWATNILSMNIDYKNPET
jgi:hypothetical protein